MKCDPFAVFCSGGALPTNVDLEYPSGTNGSSTMTITVPSSVDKPAEQPLVRPYHLD